MQKKEDATDLQEKSTALKKQTEEAEDAKNDLESKRYKAMVGIGNLVHDSVPVDNDEVIANASLQVIKVLTKAMHAKPKVVQLVCVCLIVQC